MVPPSLPPPIGSPEWSEELATIGVTRARVDAVLAAALDAVARIDRELEADLELEPTPRPRPGDVDPHAVSMDGTPAEKLAAWLLFHVEVPTYGTLMYLRFVWKDGDASVRAWGVRQLAAILLHGTKAEIDSALYGLWVDFFEDPADAPFVFPLLLEALPEAAWGQALACSGPVAWEVKRAAYARAAERPDLHPALAQGVAGSFYDVFGDVHAVEARALLARIEVADPKVKAALTDVVEQPVALRVHEVLVIDDPDWPFPGSFVLVAAVVSARKVFVPGSELVADGVTWGRLVHVAFPFQRGTAHHAVIATEPTPSDAWVYRVEGDGERVAALVGRVIEAWPAGLAPTGARA